MLQNIKKISKIVQIVFLIVFVYFVVVSFFLYFINKNKIKITNNAINQSRQEIYKAINDPKINSTQGGKFALALYRKMICGIIGEACTNNPEDGNKNVNRSLFGYMTKLIVFPYANPPASAIYWAYSGLQNAGFVPKTYAAEGIGFSSLKPLMNLWKIFRDIAYLVLVLVLVGIGFMIMFRMKLNPQTVTSIENSLPKIVIALILITFSFAIAGLIIDLMYILIAIAISAISNNGSYYNIGEFQNKYLSASGLWDVIFASKDPLGAIGNLFKLGNAFISIVYMLPLELQAVLAVVSNFLVGFIIAKLSLGIFMPWIVDAFKDPTAVGTGAGGLPNLVTVPVTVILALQIGFFIAPILLPLIIGILVLLTILFLFFRIFFLLFTTYLKIIFMIIFSPFILLFEAIPGKSAFSYWLKNLLAEILTFPIVACLFLIGYVITTQLPAAPGQLWQPPFLSGFDPSTYATLLGMGIIFMIPQIVKLTKEFLGVKGIPVSLGLGTFFGGVGAGVGGGVGLLGQVSSVSLGLSAITGKSINELFTGFRVPKLKTRISQAPGEEPADGGK